MAAAPNTTMIDYVKTEFMPIAGSSFTEVDSIVLSWLSYLRFPVLSDEITGKKGVPLRDTYLAEFFSSMLVGVKEPENTVALFAAAAASPRFRNIELTYFKDILDPDADEQFAAVTYRLAPDLNYIAFRGTDSSFTGWKEDLKLSLSDPVPSQKEALRYLEYVADHTEGTLLVGGHSKGGNLAVYASALCGPQIQSRIHAVYSFDGPGFSANELALPGFAAIRGKIHKWLPQSSLIGMAFEQETACRIVRSSKLSIAQHEPFSWLTDGGDFVPAKELTPDAKVLYTGLNNWMSELNEQERERFINVAFDLLEKTGEPSFDELGENFRRDLPLIAGSIAALDKETRVFLLRVLGGLAASEMKSMNELLHGARAAREEKRMTKGRETEGWTETGRRCGSDIDEAEVLVPTEFVIFAAEISGAQGGRELYCSVCWTPFMPEVYEFEVTGESIFRYLIDPDLDDNGELDRIRAGCLVQCEADEEYDGAYSEQFHACLRMIAAHAAETGYRTETYDRSDDLDDL